MDGSDDVRATSAAGSLEKNFVTVGSKGFGLSSTYRGIGFFF